MKITVVSGGFDPLHSGHIAYINNASLLGDYLIVALNSDNWPTRKKGQPFMCFDERKEVVSGMKDVDLVIPFIDDDGSACDAIDMCLQIYDLVIFCNGGDRNDVNAPEFDTFKTDHRVHFRWKVGGDDKHNSSSKILERWSN